MIFVINLISSQRRLLRKKMYNAPHERNRNTYFRENKNLVKHHQKEFSKKESNIYRRKLRPKREVEGYKMSYRYKYYNIDIIEEDDKEELE